MGKRYVLHWFYRSSNRTQHEIDLDVLWRSKTFGYKFPLFLYSLTAMILGTQMFLAGFIGELISRNSPNRNNYKIEDEI